MAFLKPLPTATATPTPLPTATPAPSLPTPPSGFTAFVTSDYSWGMYYPSGWQNQGSTNEELFNSGTGADVAVISGNGEVPSSQYSSILKAFADATGAKNIHIGSSVSQTSSGANTWNALKGTMTLSNISFTIVLYGTNHNGATYIVLEVAPTAQLGADNTSYFQTMLQSFTFFK
jgi:hypothetical protein